MIKASPVVQQGRREYVARAEHGEKPIDLRERFLGCPLGCAVGDALGAPYEGLWSYSIPDKATLLSGFGEYEGYPPGQYTDDTQLSVATVKSILRMKAVNPPDIARSIADLWRTQSVIGPDGSCTHAATHFLRFGVWTTCGAAVGQAGNGTAMRTACLGLYFLDDPERLPAAAADVSRITHQDPRSVAGGVAVARAAQLLSLGGLLDPSNRVSRDLLRWSGSFRPGWTRTRPRLYSTSPGPAWRGPSSGSRSSRPSWCRRSSPPCGASCGFRTRGVRPSPTPSDSAGTWTPSGRLSGRWRGPSWASGRSPTISSTVW
ncbi:MAG: ADP-ribosylglycohydrolase family protein [Gemmataceae bacterium]|nr:ADP-ribosylglycohydrolase family protein [Gemmataceae bacterium]